MRVKVPAYQRKFVDTLVTRLRSDAMRIQVIVGPRQVGKTTGIQQALAQIAGPSHYASADDVLVSDQKWLLEQWQHALAQGDGSLLVIDEIQKVPAWSSVLKGLWDQEPFRLRVIVLGSSALQIQAGLTESLAGRFELIEVMHWRFSELQDAFDYDLDRYLRFGGYPGAVIYENDTTRWHRYMKDAIVEAVIGRDILQIQRISKPALFRQAFEIFMHYPAQEISYTKLLGQLQDRGNTDLVKHYLELYEGAFLLHALQKYALKPRRMRGSSPKMLPGCPALHTAVVGPLVSTDPSHRGRVFELAVGLELMQQPGTLSYWRDGQAEVDFVYEHDGQVFAIEVKSGWRTANKGLDQLARQNPRIRRVILAPDHFARFARAPHQFLDQVGI